MENKTTINAKIVADSVNIQGNRITTYVLTYPRMIHAEVMTHRMFSRNAASSRAIPFSKMVKDVQNNPFIPIAWQKHHPGMQGTEYYNKTDKFNLSQFVSILIDTLHSIEDPNSKEYKTLEKSVTEKVDLISSLLSKYKFITNTLDEWWILARNMAVEAASIFYVFDVTKQLCNRLLEPFLWYTCLVTATEYDNFFELRCPKYYCSLTGETYLSKKDYIYDVEVNNPELEVKCNDSELEWIQHSTSGAEIHIQALAEAMWDARNESTPKQLQPGEWHIPFGDKIEMSILDQQELAFKFPDIKSLIDLKLKISTARCARLSYMTFDGEIDYAKDIALHDTLLKSRHMSPFEHVAKCMSELEYYSFIKGEYPTTQDQWGICNYEHYPIIHKEMFEEDLIGENPNNGNKYGWCNNFRGFIPYRYLIEK